VWLSLPEILLLLLSATIAGADDFVEVALWGQEHLDFLRRTSTILSAWPALGIGFTRPTIRAHAS